MQKKCNLAIVGATGLVGKTMLKILEERNFPINKIKLLASQKSAGNKIKFKNNFLTVEELNENSFEYIDIALFSAGSFVSEKFAPIATNAGCIVIDNGSFWRMKENIPLVVPEVNAHELHKHQGLIANPNCSTIQLVVPLHFISKINKPKHLIISTYQAISGAGQKKLEQFYSEIKNFKSAINSEICTDVCSDISSTVDDNFQNKIVNSIMFHSDFNECGNTIEEEKMINETRKILDLPSLSISATCVRIPVENSHCISANIEFSDACNFDGIKNILSNSEGIIFVDSDNSFTKNYFTKNSNSANICNYPIPLMCNNRNEIFVGRLRKNTDSENAISLWIAADNLRKGAATNAIQIAEYILARNL